MPDLPDVISPHLQGICSSGATGTPKIILSAQPAMLNPVFGSVFAQLWMPVERPQAILVLAPMYHVNAFATDSMLAGDRLVVLEKFDARRAIDVIGKHQVTTFTATPTMLQRIADVPGIDDQDLSSLAWILQGAAPMPPSLVHRWATLIGAGRIIMAYGSTEGFGLTALSGEEWMGHQGSVGRPLPGTEVKILGEDDKELAPGEIGDVFLRSASGGSTYLGDVPQARRTADGFATMGDLGHLDADGYLYLADRRADLIITGGANVFPAEVESALIDNPKIADIVVIGLKDPEWGRRVHAIIDRADPQSPPTAQEVRDYAKSRLAAYKVPKDGRDRRRDPAQRATKVNRGRLIEARVELISRPPPAAPQRPAPAPPPNAPPPPSRPYYHPVAGTAVPRKCARCRCCCAPKVRPLPVSVVSEHLLPATGARSHPTSVGNGRATAHHVLRRRGVIGA